MAVLITGATGFLGGRLAQILADAGQTVRVLARPGSDLEHLTSYPVEIVQGDLSDVERLCRAVRGVTHIYHCAGCSTDWAPWDVYYKSNVAGVRNLLQAAARVPELRRFLHVSTTD